MRHEVIVARLTIYLYLIVYSATLEDVMDRYQRAVSELRKFETQEILQFLETNSDDVLKLSMDYIASMSRSKSHLSTRSEHPEWFEGELVCPLF